MWKLAAALCLVLLAGCNDAPGPAPTPKSEGNVIWYCDQIHCENTKEGPPSPPPWCCEKRMVRHKSSIYR